MSKAKKKTVQVIETKKVEDKKIINDKPLLDKHIKELSSIKSISDKIRYLDKEGFPYATISRHLNKRYQHVRNVLQAEPKKVKKAEVVSINNKKDK